MSEGTPPRKSLRDGAFAERALLCTRIRRARAAAGCRVTRTDARTGRQSATPPPPPPPPEWRYRFFAFAATDKHAYTHTDTNKSIFARDPRGKPQRRWRRRPAPGSELKFVSPPHSRRSTVGASLSGSSSRPGGGGPRGEASLLSEIYCGFSRTMLSS